MSADDFQTKYSSVMEVMLKGAIAETTKLFETMVDELKAEISKIKKENEDLKTKCSQFETERNQPVGTREREPLPGPSDGSDKRDRAVQCDLVPFRTMLVEHCKQLRPSSLQEQQCRYEEMEYSLQDHNYGEPIAQMAFTLAKQKDCDGESSVQMQEEDEPIDICGLVLSDSSEAGSTWESTCGTENEGPLVDPEGSPGGIPLPEKDGEARVALDLPCLEMDRDLQRAQNQSSVSLAEVKDAMENESQGSQKISEAQGELIPSEKQLVVSLHQSEVDLLENKRPSVVPQQCEGLKGGVAEGEASSQPELPVPRRRGRPPKKAKGPKQPVKKKGSPAVSVASLSKRCYNEKEKPSVSHQYSTEIEEGAIQTPFSDVSTAVETLNTPTAQSRERCTSVTLQDAMLLVEAMNQSPVENKFSIPQKVAAAPQTKRAPNASTLETVVEVSAEPGALQFPVETHKAAGNLPVIELSKTTQCTKENLSAAPTTAGAAPTSEAQAHIKVVKPKQQHTIIPSSTTTYLMPSSTAAVQTSVQFLQQHPPTATLITSVAVSKESKAVSPITVMPRSVSSLNPHEIKALSPAQLPAVVSTVVAAQKKSIHPGVKTAVLPLGTPSLSSVPQKTIYVTSGKSFPVVSSLSTATSTDPQSRTVPHPKITIIIPRQVSAVASRKPQSQTIVPTTKQESEKSTVPIEVFSPQFVTSQQELGISVETQTILDKVDTKLFQKRDDTSDNLESRVQTTSESETINAPTETCSSLNMSLGPVPTALSPAVLPTCRQKLSAVVRLTRLPFQVSAKEAVFVSRLSTEGSSETQTISKECTTEEKPSSVVISTQPSDLLLATDICPDAEEASVTLSVNTSQVSGEPNDIQENASLFSENCSILEESPDSGYVQPSTPSKVSPVFDNSTIAVNTTEPPAASGTAGGPTTKSDEEIYEDCSLPNGQPIGEKPSTPVTHLTSNTPKDTSDPHLQMTKAQFLAKLAVSPVTQDLQKASFDDPGNATASSSHSDKKMLPEKSVVAKLRSHFKTHLQARRSVTNPEPHTETETSTVIPTNPVNPRLENESPNDKNTPREPIPPNPKHLGSGKDVRSSKMTTNGRTPISPRRSGLRKDGVRPKRNVSEATSVCSMRVKATRKSSPVSHRRSSSGIGSKTKKSSSVSPGKSSPVKESARSRKSKSTLVCPRRSSLIQELASSKKTKATSVSPRRSGSIKESASPKKTESTSVSPRRSNSIKESANSKKTKNISVSPRGTSSSRDGATPKKTKSTISTRMSGLSKNGSTPKVPTSELTYFCRRKCTVTNVGSSSNQVNRESNSFSPRYSITADGAGNETASPSVSWPKLTKDVVTPRNKEDPTAAKKPRLVQDSPGSQKNVRVVDANKLAKAAKAKAMAKIKKSAELLQNGAKISQVADNLASCGTVRKFTAKAVWTPPRVSVSKKTPTGGKKEASSPRSPDQPLVFPPSVSLFPIPIKGPPVVSPLQPLSVIGRRLLKNQCGECGQVLSSIAALESHVSLHKGRRPFSCTLCGKSFPDTKGLKRHGRVHRNGRIHICSHCGKGFVYRFGLTKHLQMVHSRIKPFICQICNRGFFTKRDVEAHIRMHTGEKPFHCNLCEKKFARRVELNVHLRWHNGEKRHWCPFCGKGFLDFNNLKRHKYIHTGEKPHSCPHCPKNFTQSGHLKKHVKNVHKIP